GALCRVPAGHMTYDASADLRAYGLLAALWAYGRAERTVPSLPTPVWPLPSAQTGIPDLVCVQSESFFDPRPYYPALRPELLARFDLLCGESCLHGQVAVPAW